MLNGLHIDDGTGSSRTIDVQPYRKWNGTTVITIKAVDLDGAEGTASFTFIVNTVNESPVANNDTLSAPEDANTFLNVLGNDTDGDLETNPDTEVHRGSVRDRQRPQRGYHCGGGRQWRLYPAQRQL